MGKGSARRKEDTEKIRSNWDTIFGEKKPAECPECGADDYESVKTKPGNGDPSHTYCLCNHCGKEFDGQTIWD